MNSGLFEALGGKARMPHGNPMQMLSQLRQNPMQFLQRAGIPAVAAIPAPKVTWPRSWKS